MIRALALLASCTTLATSSRSQPSPQPASATAETEGGELTRRYEQLAPYPTAPADPWTSVVGDQPRRLSSATAEMWTVRSNDHACTAKADHCFVPEAWIFEADDDARRSKYRVGRVFGFGPTRLEVPINARGAGLPGDPYTAYRTVPATRTNLVPGALVATLGFDKPTIDRGAEVFERPWYLGVVERVDWEMGFVYLTGQDRTYWIAGTRTAVLAWRPGGRVEILGGRTRDKLAVRADEVTLPASP